MDAHVPAAAGTRMWPEATLTVSWEASRLKVGRQWPWGALGGPPLQAATRGTVAL